MPGIVRVFAPATVANLGPGFDILGMAVTGLGDTITAHRVEQPGVKITAIRGDGGQLPYASQKNTAAIAAAHVLQQIDPKAGIELEIDKGLPLASGLGSSAASAVAGAVAANALFDNPHSIPELLPACLEGEAAVSGRHADNAAPALMGGITLVTGPTAAEIHSLPIPASLYLALITPQIAIPTAQARAVLPDQIPFRQLAVQTAAVAQLVHALYTENLALLVDALGRDGVVEPNRQHLIPNFVDAKQTALATGALALIISGAGPTLCAFSDDEKTARQIALAVQDVFIANKIAATSHIAQPSLTGAYLL